MTTARADHGVPRRIETEPVPLQPGPPRLRVVPEGYVPPAVRKRRRALVVRGVIGLLAVVFFGVAVAQTKLIDSQLELQRIETDVADLVAQNQRLRLEVSRLESPERVVAAAQERLGMLPPPTIVYLSPAGPSVADAPVGE